MEEASEIRAAEKPTSTCTLWALLTSTKCYLQHGFTGQHHGGHTTVQDDFVVHLKLLSVSISKYKEWRRVLCDLWCSKGLSSSLLRKVMKTFTVCEIKNEQNNHRAQTLTEQNQVLQLNSAFRVSCWVLWTKSLVVFTQRPRCMHMTPHAVSLLRWPGPMEGWADGKELQHFKSYSVQPSVSAWH